MGRAVLIYRPPSYLLLPFIYVRTNTMSDRLFIILVIVAMIVGAIVTTWVYDDPRCIIAECRIIK